MLLLSKRPRHRVSNGEERVSVQKPARCLIIITLDLMPVGQ